MKKPLENYAFIDSQNLNLGIQNLGWKLDFKKFRIYLKEKYGVKKAYLFLGLILGNQDLYQSLQSAGFILIFKPVLEYADGNIKGNCDAELVLQAMIDFKNYKQAVIVTGDGDFHCLARHFLEKNKLRKLLAPSYKGCSALLRRLLKGKINFLGDLRKKLEYKKKKLPARTKP